MSEFNRVENLFKQFDKTIASGHRGGYGYTYYTTLQDYLDNMLAKSSMRERARISTKIMWRLVSTAKKANLENNEQRKNNFLRLLHQNCKYFVVDENNKNMAGNVLYKNGIEVGQVFSRFISTPNNEQQTQLLIDVFAEENKRKLDLEIIDGINQAFKDPKELGIKQFEENTSALIDTMMFSTIEHIHLSPLYEALQKRTEITPLNYQASLFEENTPKKDSIDKKAVQIVADVYAKKLSEAGHMAEVNPRFVAKFKNLMTAVVTKNSFSRNEVKELAKNLKHRSWVSKEVEATLTNLGNNLVDVYDQKQRKQVQQLLDWTNKNAKAKPLEKTAFVKTFVDALHNRFVKDEAIIPSELNKKYSENKDNLKKKITDEYTRNKDYKSAQDSILNEANEVSQLTFKQVNVALNKNHNESSFYRDILKQSQDIGLKADWASRRSFKPRDPYFGR